MEAVTRIKTKEPTSCQLTAITHDTHDTKTFGFGLPAPATLDILPGDYLYIHAPINGKAVKRPYTPSSMPGATGYVDLTVKRYETGLVSKYLHDREIGDTVLMSGSNQGGHWSMAWRRKWGLWPAAPGSRR
jgi:cytochrome-b5 reductase